MVAGPDHADGASQEGLEFGRVRHLRDSRIVDGQASPDLIRQAPIADFIRVHDDADANAGIHGEPTGGDQERYIGIRLNGATLVKHAAVRYEASELASVAFGGRKAVVQSAEQGDVRRAQHLVRARSGLQRVATGRGVAGEDQGGVFDDSAKSVADARVRERAEGLREQDHGLVPPSVRSGERRERFGKTRTPNV